MAKTYGQFNQQTLSSPNHIRQRSYTNPLPPHTNQSKRVWVKRISGNPTTIKVGPNDIVDDLKLAVTNKFPNSLARYYDPADIQIKIKLRLHTSSESQQQGRRSKMNNPSLNRLLLESPEDHFRKLPTTLTPNIPITDESTVTLEPDQNIWEVLDDYFAGSMAMSDAFIIGVELPAQDVSPEFVHYLGAEEFRGQRAPMEHPNSLSHHRTTSPLSANSLQYHQPKPQHAFQIQPLSQNNLDKNQSASPSLPNRMSPVHSGNFHKRSVSNPPHSPSHIVNPTTKPNSQAVLLLPKNFSLGEQHPLKRYSLDENLVRKKFADHATVPKSPVGPNTNVTNIGKSTTNEISRDLESNSDLSKFSENNDVSDSPTPTEQEKLSQIITKDKLSLSSGSHTHDARDKSKNRDAEKSKVANNTSKPENKGLSTSTFEKVLPSISVLVVEDNAINQAILGAFLRKHKIHYQIAKNGQEAIDKWRKGGFHLVLMDIQLPVKSGIEATKEIRNIEKVNRIGVFAQHELANSTNSGQLELREDEKLDLNVFRSPVIIVALTASSNSSVDKKNALTAGCNDFLTKPVNLVWLQNKITEWGCMQSLIDFDGWRFKRTNNASAAKTLLQPPKGEKAPAEKSQHKKEMIAT